MQTTLLSLFLFNELDYLDTTLYTVTLVGSEKVDIEDCYKVEASCINEAVRVLYHSKKTFLHLREDQSNKEKGVFSTPYFSNYKKFGKMTYYTNLVFGEVEKMQKAKILELLVNENIYEDDFQ